MSPSIVRLRRVISPCTCSRMSCAKAGAATRRAAVPNARIRSILGRASVDLSSVANSSGIARVDPAPLSSREFLIDEDFANEPPDSPNDCGEEQRDDWEGWKGSVGIIKGS